ncbi:MAG: MFS transporter, partial [Gammaproteobacteria bacterium]|nr:MFS transporter [Gammaproteobacteria bacterium]
MSSTQAMRKNIFFILLIGFIVVFLSSSIKNTFQVFFIQMSDSFGQSRGEFAVAAAVFMLVFGIASPIVGLISDRIGPKRTILFGLLVSGLAFVGCALIDSFVAFVILYGVFAAFGLTAMSYVPMGILVDQSFSEKRKGLALGTLTNGAAIGFMVLSPVWVYTQNYFAWNQVFLFLGLVFLLPLFILVWRFLPEDTAKADSQNKPLPQVSLQEKLALVFSTRPFYALMFGFMGCGVTMAFIDIH